MSDSSVIKIWASQRILLRLIPPITNWLDATQSAASNISTESKELLNDFAQHEAQVELRSEAPVNSENPQPSGTGKPANSWLIHKIDVTYSDQLMELNFRGSKDRAAKLVLTKLYARQWLLILHSQWIKSDWTMDIWPLWLSQTSSSFEREMH